MKNAFIKLRHRFYKNSPEKKAFEKFYQDNSDIIKNLKIDRHKGGFKSDTYEKQFKKLLEQIVFRLVKEKTQNEGAPAFFSINLNRNWYSKHKKTLPKHRTADNVDLAYHFLKENKFINIKEHSANTTTAIEASDSLLKQILAQESNTNIYIHINGHIDIEDLPLAKITKWKTIKPKKPTKKNPNQKPEKIKTFVEPKQKQRKSFKKIKAEVLEINEALNKATIDIELTDEQEKDLKQKLQRNQNDFIRNIGFDLDSKFLHRTFSRGDINKGGRFYGAWWQGISSDLRSLIKINGNNTIEIDFSMLHPTLLYIQETGKLPTKDPYVIPEIENLNETEMRTYRDSLKTLLNAIINSTSNRISNEPPKGDDGHYLKDTEGNYIKKYTLPRGMSFVEAKKALTEHNQEIEEHFFSDAGVRLQNIDSKIALKVMQKCILQGFIALPVHDSFIVETQRKEELQNFMVEAVKEFCLEEWKLNLKQNLKIKLSDIDYSIKSSRFDSLTYIEGYKENNSDEPEYKEILLTQLDRSISDLKKIQMDIEAKSRYYKRNPDIEQELMNEHKSNNSEFYRNMSRMVGD